MGIEIEGIDTWGEPASAIEGRAVNSDIRFRHVSAAVIERWGHFACSASFRISYVASEHLAPYQFGCEQAQQALALSWTLASGLHQTGKLLYIISNSLHGADAECAGFGDSSIDG